MASKALIPILTIAFAFLPLARGAEYSILDVGTLGGTGSVAYAINDSGQIVGWAYDDQQRQQAFMWQGNTMTGLGFLAGGSNSMARDINMNGEITGFSRISATNQQAFYFHASTMTNLGTFGGPNSSGMSINRHGQMTGWAQYPTNVIAELHPRAFFYNTNKMHQIAPFNNQSSCEGNSINHAGQIGGITFLFTPNPRWWGFVWTDNNGNYSNNTGEMKLVGTMGGEISEVRSLNNQQQAVGWAHNQSGIQRAFLITAQNGLWKIPDGTTSLTNALMIPLGTLGVSNNSSSDALSINEAGWVVGTSTISTNESRAFLWRDGQMFNLNNLIPTNSGWILESATDINNNGEIVGYGTFQGQTRAFLLSREGVITRHFLTTTTELLVETNQLNEVSTQVFSRVESMDIGWTTIWSDPPTNYQFTVEYSVNGNFDVWSDLTNVDANTSVSISADETFLNTYTAAWFRIRAEY